MNLLITGASTGIGEACARWFAARGHQVFAGVRREQDGDRLKVSASGRVRPVLLDVADESSIRTALASIGATLAGAGLDGLVNNAGIAVAGPIEYIPVEGWRRQLEVNVVGQVAVTQAFLPLLRRARGRIVFIGSVGGRLSTPFLSPYCASKFALEAIADALRVELQPWRMHVALIEPGSIATPIWGKPGDGGAAAAPQQETAIERDYGRALSAFRAVIATTGARGLPADAVARAVDKALTAASPKARYVVGRDAKMQIALRQLIPDRIRDRFVTRVMKLPPRGSATSRPAPPR